ncbi:MAG: glycosyltransferase [Bacteroidales bacterium]|nr:glycosyltransferase [Bacteroidales bacterium]
MEFSVVMSVYRNDRPEFFVRAIESVTSCQTRKPDEVVIIVDGPVSESVDYAIKSFVERQPSLFRIIRFEENQGLGNALRVGVEQARCPIIARMDSDDVSLPDRFEKQIGYLESHPDCDIVGGQISEFIEKEENIIAVRRVPCRHGELIKWLKGRCPFNHMSVAMLRSRVLVSGNYMDWHFNEDYYLWIRMAQQGCRFANLPDTLVNVRVGAEMYARRGGWKYFRSEERLQRYMLRYHVISPLRYLHNIIGRFVVQVAMPNKLRAWIFRRFFRD